MKDKVTQEITAEQELWTRLLRAWHDGYVATRFELLLRYVSKCPDHVWGWVALGDVFVEFSQYDAARRALSRAQRLCPASLLGNIFDQWGHFDYERGNLGKAEAWFHRALQERIETGTLEFLADVLAKQERFSEAKRHYERAIRLADKQSGNAYYGLGVILRGERRYSAALRCFDQAIKADAEHDRAKEARKDVLRVTKLKSSSGLWIIQELGRARPRRKKGRMGSMTAAEQRLWASFFRAWSDKRQVAGAFEIGARFVRKYPDNIIGWIALGDSLINLGRYQLAQSALLRAESLSSVKLRRLCFVYWGHLFRERNNFRRAEKWYRRAVERKAKATDLVFLGAALANQGRFPEARRCYHQSTRLGNNSPDEAYYNLGLILRAEGRYAEALRALRKAFENSEGDWLAEEIQTAIQDVRQATKLRRGNGVGGIRILSPVARA